MVEKKERARSLGLVGLISWPSRGGLVGAWSVESVRYNDLPCCY